MAAVVVVAVLGVGYGVFVGLDYLYHYIATTDNKVGANKGRRVDAQLDPARGKKAVAKAGAPAENAGAPAAPAPEGETRTAAGVEQTIGFTKICVVSATRPGFGSLGGGGSGGLTITLQVTNLGAAPLTYYRKGLNLRDRAKKTYAMLEPRAENEVLQGGETKTDVLRFEPASMMHTLDLDIPASASDLKFQFYIPSTFIQTTQ
jgi:hypothetical protein